MASVFTVVILNLVVVCSHLAQRSINIKETYMIKVEYEYQKQTGTLDLPKVSDYEGKQELIDSLDISNLEYAIIEEVLSVIAPDVDPTPKMYACERGGERNVISPSSEAARLGFTKLEATIDGNEIIILART